MRLASMPFLAILTHELRNLAGSWLVRLWLIAAALLAFFTITPNWQRMPTAPLIASLLIPYLVFPWFLVVFTLGISPVTGNRLEALADGVLSRPVTRYEYLLASWTARVVTVLGVFLLVIVPAVTLVATATRDAGGDPVTWYGVIAALAVVALVLVLLVSLAFCAGTLLRRPLVAIVVLIFVWFPSSAILATFSLEQFSPISLSQALPTLLCTPWNEDQAIAEDDSLGAEQLRELSTEASKFLSVLAGTEPPKPRPTGFFERNDYRDFSLLRVVLGYGIPTVIVLMLAVAVFARRDI